MIRGAALKGALPRAARRALNAEARYRTRTEDKTTSSKAPRLTTRESEVSSSRRTRAVQAAGRRVKRGMTTYSLRRYS